MGEESWRGVRFNINLLYGLAMEVVSGRRYSDYLREGYHEDNQVIVGSCSDSLRQP